MTKTTIARGAAAIMLLVLVFAAGRRILDREGVPASLASAELATASPDIHEGLLYGRITTEDGVYEGRLRFGGDEEALWGSYFNGVKDENPWADYAPVEQLPKERHAIELFGIEISAATRFDLDRPFMARLGDIARIDPRGRDILMTLKSGTVFTLDRYAADDLADGLRVWDGSQGVVDIGEWKIHSIEFLPVTPVGSAPYPLHGTVRTNQGEFTGFVEWDRVAYIASDELRGHTVGGELSLRFDTIRSIARRSGEGALVTLVDGREILLSHTRPDGSSNRGMYVDDPRYGRVLISWGAFERVDFSPSGSGHAYGDFLPGRPLTGAVVTRSGRRLAGRLVFDLDESETTETLDAPSDGVDYIIPFGLISSILPPNLQKNSALPVTVNLHSGEALQLERASDFGEWNAGMLIFFEGHSRPEYVSWADVERIDIDRPPAL